MVQMLSKLQNELEELARRVAQGPLRRLLPAIRWAIPLLLLAFLAHSLAHIGWTTVWDARPKSVAFYLVPPVVFFLQPLTDLFIYRNLFQAGKLLRFSILLRKQSLNTLILDYSGETYFFYWAQRTLGRPASEVLHTIKDTNILSAGASLVIVVACALGLATIGDLRLPALVSGGIVPLAIGVLLPLVLFLGLVAGGRRVTSLTRRQMGAILAVFLARSLAFMLLGVLVWWLSGALPSLAVCFEFTTARLVFARLPLPNKALLFASIAIAAAGSLNLSAPHIAAVLVIVALLQQTLALALVALPWAHERLTHKTILSPLYLPQSDTDVSTP
jgi:hypothetical protein